MQIGSPPYPHYPTNNAVPIGAVPQSHQNGQAPIDYTPHSKTNTAPDGPDVGNDVKINILKYEGMIVNIVNRFKKVFPRPYLEQQDAMQAAWVGLQEAALRFDPKRNVGLGTYARTRIWKRLHQARRRNMPFKVPERRTPISEVVDATATSALEEAIAWAMVMSCPVEAEAPTQGTSDLVEELETSERIASIRKIYDDFSDSLPKDDREIWQSLLTERTSEQVGQGIGYTGAKVRGRIAKLKSDFRIYFGIYYLKCLI